MNKELLKQVIEDQKAYIKTTQVFSRDYSFESKANYVLIGLRRSGKSTLMYKQILDLLDKGIDYEQIIYLNFEDERLSDFKSSDFNDILLVKNELTDKKAYYFFDEIQNIDKWEKFARRMADSKEFIWITGSNAKMLISDAISTLGARFFVKSIYPYSFKEFLNVNNVKYKNKTLSTNDIGNINKYLKDYFEYGGLPETLNYTNKREYIELVYQKMQLGDVILRNEIRNPNALKAMVRKIAESICSDISYTRLTNILKTIGHKISKETIIDYISYIEDAFIIFKIKNFTSSFVEKEINNKYYFTDNGILNLFLVDKNPKLLENIVAIYLHQNFKENVWFLKSSVTGIDIDFVLPNNNTAIQVTYDLDDNSKDREVNNLINLASKDKTYSRFIIVTYNNEEIIKTNDITIEVVPLYKFLLDKISLLG